MLPPVSAFVTVSTHYTLLIRFPRSPTGRQEVPPGPEPIQLLPVGSHQMTERLSYTPANVSLRNTLANNTPAYFNLNTLLLTLAYTSILLSLPYATFQLMLASAALLLTLASTTLLLTLVSLHYC